MLRRIVEFLNEQMDPAEVLAIEVQQYVNDETGVPRTLVPRVFGQLQKKRSTVSGKMTWDTFEQKIRSRGADGDAYWEAIDRFRKQWDDIGGTFRPNSSGMGVHFPLGPGRSASVFYLDASEAGILWPLLPGQLAEYANQRDDLTYFTPEALKDYGGRIAEFPAAFRQPTGARDRVSMAAGNVDLPTFQRFLNMVIDFCSQAFPKRA